jgi:hypothetical protein
MPQKIMGRLLSNTGYSSNYEPQYIIEFSEKIIINSGDRIKISFEGAIPSISLIRKETNGEEIDRNISR